MLNDRRQTLQALLSTLTLGLSQGRPARDHPEPHAQEGHFLQLDRATRREAGGLAPINFVAAGGRADDAAAGKANLNLVHALIADTTVDNDLVGNPYGDGGPHIYFPPGIYHFSGPIRIRKAVHLTGSSAATRAVSNTIFIFPADRQGVVVDNDDTDNLAYLSPKRQSAAGTIIEGIRFQGSATARNEAHGVLIRAFCILKDVHADGFGGHGIYIWAQLSPGIGGQASNCLIHACGATNNAGSGLRIEGGDANIIQVVGGDYSHNGDWGVEDLSFLGNTFTGIHTTQNAQPNGGFRNGSQWHVVRWNNKNWMLRHESAGQGGQTQPGTNENVWTEYFEPLGFGNEKAPPATWYKGIGTRPGGAFLTAGQTAWSVWTGCYSEGNQGGSQMGYKALVLGGDHGSGVYATNNVGSGEAAWIDAHNGELVTKTNLRAKGILLGTTRARANGPRGMKMSARPSPPAAANVYTVTPYGEYGWEPGDIVWNQARAETQPGVIPPLGWRCTGGPADFEEIPFPDGGRAKAADAGSGNQVRSIRRTGSALPAGKALYVANEHGNHSWGQVAELAVEQGKDRPSVGFYHAPGNFGFSVGMFEDDWFKIKKQAGPRFGGFGTDYVAINPGNGDFYTAAAPKQLSDGRLKENVRSIEGALDKVCRMRGVTYTRKQTGDQSSGVIAQEIEEVAPELVSQTPDGTKAVAYANALGYLIEAIKELRTENAELRSMIGK
jgi:hypothetical protein